MSSPTEKTPLYHTDDEYDYFSRNRNTGNPINVPNNSLSSSYQSNNSNRSNNSNLSSSLPTFLHSEEGAFVNLDNSRSNPVNKPNLNEVSMQVEEVTEIVKGNIEQVVQRGERITNIENTSDTLLVNSSVFNKRSRNLKNQLWWKKTKFQVLICLLLSTNLK